MNNRKIWYIACLGENSNEIIGHYRSKNQAKKALIRNFDKSLNDIASIKIHVEDSSKKVGGMITIDNCRFINKYHKISAYKKNKNRNYFSNWKNDLKEYKEKNV
jgi:hypothetical protein